MWKKASGVGMTAMDLAGVMFFCIRYWAMATREVRYIHSSLLLLKLLLSGHQSFPIRSPPGEVIKSSVTVPPAPPL